jgi:GT2 family glycosyltransferase
MTLAYGCVIVTQGRRPEELRRAVESAVRQKDVEVDVLVVGNGWEAEGLPAGARGFTLPENLGAPAARNAGLTEVSGELVLFLDDDASLADADALARIERMFAGSDDLGAVQLHVVDPAGSAGPREWVPRLYVGDRSRSSDIVALWEGAVVVRRRVLEASGGWPAGFFYFHSGVDLGWRIWDAGYRMRYAGDVRAFHPARPARRHEYFHYLSSRNRVWLARRYLPLPLAAAHVAVWFLRTAAGLRSVRDTREVLRGYADGLRERPGERRPLRWRTIWRMTLAGRPPVI